MGIDMFMLDDAEIPAETVCNVTGWGLLYGDPFGRPPNALQWIQLPLISAEDCAEEFSGDATITEGMVCSGSKGHTTCNESPEKHDKLELLAEVKGGRGRKEFWSQTCY